MQSGCAGGGRHLVFGGLVAGGCRADHRAEGLRRQLSVEIVFACEAHENGHGLGFLPGFLEAARTPVAPDGAFASLRPQGVQSLQQFRPGAFPQRRPGAPLELRVVQPRVAGLSEPVECPRRVLARPHQRDLAPAELAIVLGEPSLHVAPDFRRAFRQVGGDTPQGVERNLAMGARLQGELWGRQIARGIRGGGIQLLRVHRTPAGDALGEEAGERRIAGLQGQTHAFPDVTFLQQPGREHRLEDRRAGIGEFLARQPKAAVRRERLRV